MEKEGLLTTALKPTAKKPLFYGKDIIDLLDECVKQYGTIGKLVDRSEICIVDNPARMTKDIHITIPVSYESLAFIQEQLEIKDLLSSEISPAVKEVVSPEKESSPAIQITDKQVIIS